MRSHHVPRVLGLLALVAALLLVTAGVAAAQTDGTSYPTVSTTPTTDPCVSTSSCGTSAVGGVSVGGVSSSRSLPFTGGDVALLTVLGLAAVGSGTAIVLIARRRSTRAHA
jgi:hypothetical protein